MPNKIVSVTENVLYDAKVIVKRAGITIDPKEDYILTITYKSIKVISHKNKGTEHTTAILNERVSGVLFTFILNGQPQWFEESISIKGHNLYRLTMATNIIFDDLPDKTVHVKVQKKGSDKVQDFVVHAKEASDDAKNKPPKITTQGKLVPGDNKVIDLVKYKDPEGQVSHVSLNVDPRPSQTKEVRLVFGGENIGNKGYPFPAIPINASCST